MKKNTVMFKCSISGGDVDTELQYVVRGRGMPFWKDLSTQVTRMSFWHFTPVWYFSTDISIQAVSQRFPDRAMVARQDPVTNKVTTTAATKASFYIIGRSIEP